MPTDGRKPLSEAIEHFVADKEKLDGSGNYADMAGCIVRQWADQHADRLEYVDDVEPRHMESYADYLARRAQARAADPTGEAGITGETAHQYYALVRAFLTHCQKWEWLSENPAIVERVTDKLPERSLGQTDTQQFWSPEERDELLAYADKQAHAAIDADGLDARTEVRDRALVYVLAYTGARASEIVRDSRDERRTGITWADVDLGDNRIQVLGKNQERQHLQLPEQAQPAIERWETVLDPPAESWPVFPTLHAPSLHAALPDDADAGDDLLDALREHDARPPSISVNGTRTILKRLCDDGDIDVDGDKDYLTPHGARRGVGEFLYRNVGFEAAQRALRHEDPSTTSQMYSHIEASELADVTSEAFESE
ncbi:site-specific integrase [Halomicroarcula sp. S1AR25-4]|uniref:tyrosine-type recombinase/integrase n=1 Tax=Haloarcula sp. S1AR25-4 TaxID=2950538 RepID=UPI00287447E8|nr:tyrosine-type recombinase/integrase [Halomicroarcula sp. S1AR25-4]MDS0280032.1 site-specific integrase [Halomicroarcula sp. S1AR25-4]